MKVRKCVWQLLAWATALLALVQGVQFYKNAKDDEQVPGLMHVNLGGYHIADIEFTAAFDVVDTKGGQGSERSDFCLSQ